MNSEEHKIFKITKPHKEAPERFKDKADKIDKIIKEKTKEAGKYAGRLTVKTKTFIFSQTFIAVSIVLIYLAILFTVLGFSLHYAVFDSSATAAVNSDNFERWYKILTFVIGAISGPVGVVIGFYFGKKSEQ